MRPMTAGMAIHRDHNITTNPSDTHDDKGNNQLSRRSDKLDLKTQSKKAIELANQFSSDIKRKKLMI